MYAAVAVYVKTALISGRRGVEGSNSDVGNRVARKKTLHTTVLVILLLLGCLKSSYSIRYSKKLKVFPPKWQPCSFPFILPFPLWPRRQPPTKASPFPLSNAHEISAHRKLRQQRKKGGERRGWTLHHESPLDGKNRRGGGIFSRKMFCRFSNAGNSVVRVSLCCFPLHHS